MARGTLLDEAVIWSGRPEVLETPAFHRAIAGLAFVVSAVSTLFALVVSRAVGGSTTSLLLVGAWAATVGLLAQQGLRVWLSAVTYSVTTHRVVVQRGPFRRTIDRNAVSFARIQWSARLPDVGDLELVRAVQTGPLRRRLTLTLRGLRQPNRVWAIVRGAESLAPRGSSALPMAQRLDTDERVLWAAKPRTRLRSYLPQSHRDWSEVGLAALLLLSFGWMVIRAVPVMHGLLAAGLAAWSLPFLALVLAEVITAVTLLAMAAYFVYDAGPKGGRLAEQTRYMITNKHVLISRGREELHLQRDKIVDVIDAAAGAGVSDVFLVLDGPRARALAASGAFGELERSASLRPVFLAVDDAESVGRILRTPPEPTLPRAA